MSCYGTDASPKRRRRGQRRHAGAMNLCKCRVNATLTIHPLPSRETSITLPAQPAPLPARASHNGGAPPQEPLRNNGSVPVRVLIVWRAATVHLSQWRNPALLASLTLCTTWPRRPLKSRCFTRTLAPATSSCSTAATSPACNGSLVPEHESSAPRI